MSFQGVALERVLLAWHVAERLTNKFSQKSDENFLPSLFVFGDGCGCCQKRSLPRAPFKRREKNNLRGKMKGRKFVTKSTFRASLEMVKIVQRPSPLLLDSKIDFIPWWYSTTASSKILSIRQEAFYHCACLDLHKPPYNPSLYRGLSARPSRIEIQMRNVIL